jgi:cell wall-associated NlpC family hydrolase
MGYDLRRAGLRLVAGLFLLLSACVLMACRNVPRTPDAVDTRGAAISRAAAQLVGTPYHFGGADIDGFDCSGLVTYVHQRVGLEVPRSANEQKRAAQPVPLSAVLPGDLVFFRTRIHIGSRVDHVGIYTGGGRFIHAPSSGGTVSYASLTEGYYRKHLVSAGRFWDSRG